MTEKTEKFIKPYLKKDLPDIRPGDTIKVFQKIEGKKKKSADKKQEKTQAFEGVVLAVKHGKGISGTFIVRKMVGGVGVERVFPIHSPNIEKIEILQRSKTRRAKLYYLRERVGKKARLRKKSFSTKVAADKKEKIEKKE